MVEGAHLALSDGRTATARVAAGAPADLVIFDLALDYNAATRIAIAGPDQEQPGALAAAAGVFQALGKAVSIADDAPGLIVMLANEAAEAVMQGVASPGDIDRAMTLGVNYPRGPLGWADAAGPALVLAVLQALQAIYGDDHYRASQWLRRNVAAGRRLSAETKSR